MINNGLVEEASSLYKKYGSIHNHLLLLDTKSLFHILREKLLWNLVLII